jgi:hypothetical protein
MYKLLARRKLLGLEPLYPENFEDNNNGSTKRVDTQGRLRLSVSKNTSLQTTIGYAGETAAQELLNGCPRCDGELYNENEDDPNHKGSDLACRNCKTKIQVKTYGPKNHSQFRSDNTLKQAGKKRIVLETMNNNKLHYMVLLYNNKKEVVRSILTLNAVKPSDIVRTYGIGEKKVSIKFDKCYDVTYD